MKSALLAMAFASAATLASAQVVASGPFTLQQWQARNWANWLQRADANHDGRISRAEVATVAGARAPMLGLVWGGWDTNHNDFLDRPEIDAMSTTGFRRADTNHDGVLDAAEIAAARARQH